MTSRLRRFGLAGFVVLSLTAAGVADRLAPASRWLPDPDAPVTRGGAWACPYLKAAGSPGWLHLANFGSEPSHVRVTYVPDRRAPITQVIDIGPGRAGTLSSPAAIRGLGAGAIVEYAGGELVVSRSALFSANGGSGGAGAACIRPGPQTIVVPQGATLGMDTQLVLLNPGSSDAVVDVALLFDGQELQPESLRGRVVQGGARLIVREGDFAFDEPIVAGVVRARSGRVVAEGLLAAPGLIELVPGVGSVGESVAVGSTSSGGPLSFFAVAIGDIDAVTDARTLSPDGQGVFEPLATGLPASTPRVAQIPRDFGPPGPVAVAASSSTSPIALGARWRIFGRGGANDQAVTAAVPPSHRSTAVIGKPASVLKLLVANPSSQNARVSVTVVTEAGRTTPAALQGVDLGAGRAVELALAGLGGQGTVGVLVASSGAPVAAAIQGISLQPAFGAYAVGTTPDLPRPTVAVDPDPRAGVPA